MDAESLFLVFLAFAAGGLLKGAAGFGAPLLAVPLMASLRDVPFAVAVFVLPNIVPNIWQYWAYRHALTARRFAWTFAIAGGLGAGLGTIALAGLATHVLHLSLGLILLAFVLFRVLNPKWELTLETASKLAIPVAAIAGALQGATGLSAPVSLPFLSAIRMTREAFIATVSMFFIGLGVVQLPAQLAFGIMTPDRFAYSALALVPLFAFLPVGAWIGRKIPEPMFQAIVLALLFAIAVKMIMTGLG
jgi:uncharacterized membrane protein YfcA